MNETCCEAALRYLKEGLAVVPVYPASEEEKKKRKRPMIKWMEGEYQWPTEENVKRWYKKCPDARVGILTGKRSKNRFVLDCDTKEDAEYLINVLRIHEQTKVIRTPSGGIHVHFSETQAESKTTVSKIRKDFDTRGKGGMVIMPPSPGYELLSKPEVEVLVVPDGMAKAKEILPPEEAKPCQEKHFEEKQAGGLRSLSGAIEEGTRNAVVFGFSRVLRDCNYQPDDVTSIMKKIACFACIPPYAGEKEDKELENTVNSAFSQAPLTRSTGSSHGYSLLPNVVIHSCEEKESNVSVETDWLWKGYVAKGLITLLSSDSYGGKTTLVFHLLREMFALQPFLGQPTNLTGGVLVLTEEPEHLFTDRLRDLGLTKCPITWIHHYQLFGVSEDVMLETVKKHIEENKIELVIVDTLSSFSKSEDENDAVETRKGVRPFERMAHELKTGLIIFHHLNVGYGDRGQEPRGSTALKGVSHIELKMKYGGEEFQRKLIARSKVFNCLPDDLVVELKNNDYQVIGNATKMTKAKIRQRCKDALEEKPMEIEKLKRKNPSLPSHVRLKKILDECVKEGDGVGRKGNGLRGHAWAYYRQKEKDDTSVIHTSASNMNLNNADLKSGKAKV